MYDISQLYEATSVENAIELLTEHPEAMIIAGGSDVLIKMREGKLAGKALVSIYGLDELRGVTMEEDGTLRIRPLTSFTNISKDPLLLEHVSALSEAAGTVGGPQVRNIGTIGGNVCNGVTSADTGATLMAWDAKVEVCGPNGKRIDSIADFYITAGKVDLGPGEIVTALLIAPENYRGYKGYYFKYAMRNAMDIATSTCSVNVKLSEDKKHIEDCRIAYGVAGPVPMRCPEAEAEIAGKPVSKQTIDDFAKTAVSEVNPRTSWRASKEFRTHILKEIARRSLTESILRAGGEIDE